MIFSTFKIIDNLIKFNKVKAHCDIPCGIYDPIPAQIAAMTTVRMTDTIIELEEHEAKEHDGARDMHYNNKISRMISEKDRSAEIVKHEIRIIWGDFFKEPQFKSYPELHNLVHEIMLLTSKCKQTIDQKSSRDMVEKINRFAEIFWQIKEVEYSRVKFHCKPNLEIVFPKF